MSTTRSARERDERIVAKWGRWFGGLDVSRLEPNKGGGIGIELLSDRGDGILDEDEAFRLLDAILRILNRLSRARKGKGRK